MSAAAARCRCAADDISLLYMRRHDDADDAGYFDAYADDTLMRFSLLDAAALSDARWIPRCRRFMRARLCYAAMPRSVIRRDDCLMMMPIFTPARA